MNPRHILVGQRVRIHSSGFVIEGTRTYGEGTNYGTDEKPNWYITMEDDKGHSYYWKQEYDGGTVEILKEPLQPTAMDKWLNGSTEAVGWDVVETSSDYVDEVDYEEANRQYTTGEYELPASVFARSDGIILTTSEQDKEVLDTFRQLYSDWLNHLPEDMFDSVCETTGQDLFVLALNWWATGDLWDQEAITDIDENDIPF